MLNRSIISLEQTPVLRLQNVCFPIEVRRSSRARRFSLKVSHTERAAILTLPNRGCVEDASAFLARHSDWLKRQIERLPEPIPFADGASIPLRGNFHRLAFQGLLRDKGIVWVEPTPSPSDTMTAPLPVKTFSEWCDSTQSLAEAPLP